MFEEDAINNNDDWLRSAPPLTADDHSNFVGEPLSRDNSISPIDSLDFLRHEPSSPFTTMISTYPTPFPLSFPDLSSISSPSQRPGDKAKSVRYRQLDTYRRRNENAAIERLRSFMKLIHGTTQTNRASTLHCAADTIEKLMERVETLERLQRTNLNYESNKQQRLGDGIDASSMNTNSEPLIMAAHNQVTRDLITESLDNDNVFAELFMNATIMQIVLDCGTGACLFVNDAFLSTKTLSREVMKKVKAIIPSQQFVQLESPRNIYDETKRVVLPDGTILSKRHHQPHESVRLFKQLYL